MDGVFSIRKEMNLEESVRLPMISRYAKEPLPHMNKSIL